MNEKELRTFRRHLREIERYIAGTLKDQTSCCGVTMAQCHVLLEFDGREVLTNAGLARDLRLDASTLSRTVDGLVKAGLIGRAENPQNRRSSQLTLTGKGRETLEIINESCDRYYSGFFDVIPEEKHAALVESIELLSRLFSGYDFQKCSDDRKCHPVNRKENAP